MRNDLMRQFASKDCVEEVIDKNTATFIVIFLENCEPKQARSLISQVLSDNNLTSNKEIRLTSLPTELIPDRYENRYACDMEMH